MSEAESRADRRERQTREVEESQRELRESIENTRRLLDESDQMLARHRREWDEGEAEPH
jgi:hypothetical protein